MINREIINRLRYVAQSLREGYNPLIAASFLDATAERIENAAQPASAVAADDERLEQWPEGAESIAAGVIAKYREDYDGTNDTIAEVLGDAASALLESQVERVANLEAVIAKVRELHRPYGIYGECGHEHDPDDTGVYEEGVVDVEEVGLTCAKMYDVCDECCTDDGGDQTECCAASHIHALGVPICKTAAIIAEAEEQP